MASRRYWRGRPLDYGEGALQRLPHRVAEAGWQRLLLVCGRTSFEASGAAAIIPALERQAQVHRWSDFTPNPDSADLARGLDILRKTKADAILAIGGGSAMDMAKLLCAYGNVAGASDLLEAIRIGERVAQRRLGLHLVPTTSGSGSEATHFAVVYIGEEKFSVAGPALYADSITLDPSLTLSGSSYQRATSGIDAVCQAIESLWARGATGESRRYARHALRLLLPRIEPFVLAAEPEAARGMVIGAHLAGRAIDISKTTAAHALSYALTKRYGVSHGHAVALSLGGFIEVHAAASPERLQEDVDPQQHKKNMRTILHALKAQTPSLARAKFEILVQRLGLICNLAKVGCHGEDCKNLAKSVNVERLANNPVNVNTSELADLLCTPFYTKL